MLGGAGKDTITPETHHEKGAGTVHTSFRLFRSQRDAESTKPSSPRLFKKQDLLCRMNEGGGLAAFKRPSKSSNASPPNPTWVSPEPGSSPAGSPLALRALERWKVLVPGKEAVSRTPPGSWVTEPAESGSSRSLMTGPHCYCFCGEPWSRTRRATPVTPAPGRWGR